MGMERLTWSLLLDRCSLSFGRKIPFVGNVYSVVLEGGAAEGYLIYVMSDNGLKCLAKSDEDGVLAFNTVGIRDCFSCLDMHEVQLFHVLIMSEQGVVAEGDLPIRWQPLAKCAIDGAWQDVVTMVGPVGPAGPQGPVGPQGVRGNDGGSGPRGVDGRDGATGATGKMGPQGDTGPVGPRGPQGLKGDKGDTGPQGPAGPQGAKGDDGPKGDEGEIVKIDDEWIDGCSKDNPSIGNENFIRKIYGFDVASGSWYERGEVARYTALKVASEVEDGQRVYHVIYTPYYVSHLDERVKESVGATTDIDVVTGFDYSDSSGSSSDDTVLRITKRTISVQNVSAEVSSDTIAIVPEDVNMLSTYESDGGTDE